MNWNHLLSRTPYSIMSPEKVGINGWWEEVSLLLSGAYVIGFCGWWWLAIARSLWPFFEQASNHISIANINKAPDGDGVYRNLDSEPRTQNTEGEIRWTGWFSLPYIWAWALSSSCGRYSVVKNTILSIENEPRVQPFYFPIYVSSGPLFFLWGSSTPKQRRAFPRTTHQ